jgi:hypothetical protein
MDEPNEPNARELVHRAARVWMDEAESQFELVPLALLALEVDEPIEVVADRLGDQVKLDDIGMRTVPSSAAREFLADRAEQTRRMEAQARRLQEAHVPSPVAVGVPALENGSAMESLMAHDPGYLTVAEEFGLPKPTFLDDMLAEGQRAAADQRAEAELLKKAQRVLDGQDDKDR